MGKTIETALGTDGNRDDRLLAARLRLVVDSLTATILFNPTGTLLAAAALYVGREVFGHVAIENLAAAIGVQVVGAAAAWIVQRYLHEMPCDPHRAQWILVALQAMLALAWGATGWLFWCDGNAANNIYIALIMLIVVFSTAMTRASCRSIFLAGALTINLAYALVVATHHGIAAHILLAMVPFWTAYILMMGEATKRRVDEMLKARFANEDMSVALRLAHENALRKRYEAEAANASKTAFLANMSHELRTPLNAILGFSDIIAEQSFGPGKPCYQDYARDIHTSGAHLLDLINDILDVAKIESGKMELDAKAFDVSRTLVGIKRQMAIRATEKKQFLTFTVEEGTPPPVADERAFKQIVLNLVSNAIKFTPEGGRIGVTCRRGEDNGLLLVVDDTGLGIPSDRLEKVFDAFSQIDNRYDRKAGGTGLGLALVQGLAQLHGGRAWIESTLGRGTTVFVYFPLAIERQQGALKAFG